MKWKKLGKIFDTSLLVEQGLSFAQSPQTLVLEDRIRIFFSTRISDQPGKYISKVASVDFDLDLMKTLDLNTDVIVSSGNLGCYDEHGIFPLNILKINAEKTLGFIGGWSRRQSVSVDGSIGLAHSIDNGKTFERLGNGPVITASLQEPFLVADPFVLIHDNIYYMAYIYGERWIKNTENIPERVYKINYATSTDAVNWKKGNGRIINDVINENECQALPTVIRKNGLFHMYFCYRDVFGFRKNKSSAYKIGYAYSKDFKKWERDDKKSGIVLSESNLWDSQMMCYPHIFEAKGETYLLYNGNNFGKEGFGAAILEKE